VTYRDLDLHAKWPFGHLFEQNIIEEIGADDAHGANGFYNTFVRNYCDDEDEITLEDMQYWSFLGNIKDDFTNKKALLYDADHGPIVDLFGYTNNYTSPVTHWMNDAYGYQCELADVSYYYSARPDFLPSGTYTWPALGTETNLTQNIPAHVRFGYTKKTYLADPTPKPLTYSGTLPYSQTWSGTHTLTGDITVPSGITLTIAPGTYVNIPAGKKITVEGILIAQGTESEPITFQKSSSSSWYSLKFEDSSIDSDCILDHCIIKNASYAIFCNNASPTITNCTIGWSIVGIYGYYSSTTQHIENNEIKYNTGYGILLSHPYAPIIFDNDIHNYGTNIRCVYGGYATTIRGNKIHESGSSCDGIFFSQSTPIVIENMIYDNGRYGVACSNNSAPEFLHEDISDENNVIAYNSSYGVWTDGSSLPVLGGIAQGSPDRPAHNSIYSNSSYDVYNQNSTQICATYDWWGQATPNPARFYGSVDYSHPLSSDPNTDPHGLGKGTPSSSNDLIAGDSDGYNKEARKYFDKGYKYELEGNYEQAVIEYQYVIDNYPAEAEATMSLVHLTNCNKKLGQNESNKTKVKSVADAYPDYPVGGKAKELDAAQDLQDGLVDEALSKYSDLAVKFEKDELGKNALFEKWQVYFNNKKDEKSARTTMEEYERKYPDDEMVLVMQAAMGDVTFEMTEKMPKAAPGNNGAEDTVDALGDNQHPKVYALFANYPNPFNPETLIKYALPKESHIVIQVYNVLGQKIATLLDAEMTEGYHVVKWNGRNSAG